MATNIPFGFMAYVWDDKEKAFPWSLNPDFVKLVKERFSPEGTILVTCRSSRCDGNQHACGRRFTNAYNILDGMEGQPGRRP
jgi:hypothetical protein